MEIFACLILLYSSNPVCHKKLVQLNKNKLLIKLIKLLLSQWIRARSLKLRTLKLLFGLSFPFSLFINPFHILDGVAAIPRSTQMP